MRVLSNIPSSETLLRLAARKSFSLEVKLRAVNGSILPIVESSAWLVVGKNSRLPSSTDSLFTLQPALINEDQGLLRFDFQASHLDLPAGEYPYEIILESLGYSTIAVQGVIDLQASVDYAAVNGSYTDPASVGTLGITLSKNSITVRSEALAVRGAPGVQGLVGKSGDPFAQVEIDYNEDGQIIRLLQDDTETTYSYNPDGTIASDTRDSVTRDYIYTAGKLTSIVPREIG